MYQLPVRSSQMKVRCFTAIFDEFQVAFGMSKKDLNDSSTPLKNKILGGGNEYLIVNMTDPDICQI